MQFFFFLRAPAALARSRKGLGGLEMKGEPFNHFCLMILSSIVLHYYYSKKEGTGLQLILGHQLLAAGTQSAPALGNASKMYDKSNVLDTWTQR